MTCKLPEPFHQVLAAGERLRLMPRLVPENLSLPTAPAGQPLFGEP